MNKIKTRLIWIFVVLLTLFGGRTLGHSQLGSNIVSSTLLSSNGMLDKVLFDGGYFKGTPISSGYGFTLYYYNKDHLGNNREVVNASGSVQQVTNYYPFGAPYADLNAVVNASYQPYKYNGKELDLMHGLNTYDYGARQYDPILSHFMLCFQM